MSCLQCKQVLVKHLKIVLYFFILTFFLLIDNTQVLAQQRILSGITINKRTTWSGTIIVEGDITISKNARLSIEPGTRILFRPGVDKTSGGKDKTRSEIIVEGILIVKGQLDNKVTFTSAAVQPRMGDWYGIQLLNTKDISIIDYCVIEYGYNGISLKKSNPLIRNSQIRLNYNTGILSEVKAEPIISKNIISENGYAGIIASLGSKPVLTNNLISLNQIGVIAFSLSQPNLGNLGTEEKYNAGQNNIFENFEYDLYNHTTMPIMAENNSWGSNVPGDIDTRIYDYNDENKYGLVDAIPYYQQNNLEDLFQLSQSSAPSAVLTPATAVNLPSDSAGIERKTASSGSLQVEEQLPGFAFNSDGQPGTKPAEIEKKPLVKSSPPVRSEPVVPVEKKAAGPQIDYNKIFLEPFLDNKKKVINQSAPVVSNLALGFGAKGRIIVRAVVGKRGEVESAMVIKGLNDYYDRIAIEAALKFKYSVGTYRDVPVRFYTNIFFEF